MTERTTVRLPGDLLGAAKRKAAAEGRTLTALIEEGLRRVIAEPASRAPARRTIPRISTARGRQVARDLTELADLEDVRYAHGVREP
ncbi:MAG TPA: hypothetical protein VG939_13420 [Caulobacteraceae bacterium]|nr:hypothetical protein [Caulobacteraceae bacterium]